MSADFYRGVLKILKYQFCCGDDVTEVTNETTGMILAASADSLGTCDSVSGGKMMFASDGTNGLDGKNGINGIDGTSCTATALSDSSSYKIMCGEDSVGVILNGADGAQGRLDEAGDGCSLTDIGDGTLLQVCGEDSVTLYKAFCGNEVYNPTKMFCDVRDFAVYDYVKIGSQIWMAENLNYNYNNGTATSYCYNNSAENCEKYGRLYTWAAVMDSASVLAKRGMAVVGVRFALYPLPFVACVPRVGICLIQQNGMR